MTGPNGQSSGGHRINLERQFDRLIAEMIGMGIDPVLVGSAPVETSVVDAVLGAMRQMAGLLKLEHGHGFAVLADNLIRGMVVDYSPMTTFGSDEPQSVVVDHVAPAGDGLVVVHGEDGFVSLPVAADFRFHLVAGSDVAIAEQIIDAEQQRIGPGLDELSKRRERRHNDGGRFRLMP